ncbi:uncharacterized protein LOC123558463 [Mercenaria mercenaria]|uniref:uncharacterized protein LOC123558463 n=1 Tax=Mercenaria mercenaria TaxID=6596 RepID=UPI00234F7FEE|nr:uncharacterized protein LOC123558463 [Mercenaria mercenaria]
MTISQEKRGNETSYKLKTTQQVFEEKAFQDGNNAKSPKSSSERRLRHKSRPKRCHYNHRCEWNVGLGWSHEQPYSARPLVKVREIATHQHSGNESCKVNCPTFSSCSRKQECINQIGQHLGMSIHQSPAGYTFTSSMLSDLGLVGFSPETQYESQSSPHHGEVQQLGRLFEQEESAGYRVESEQNSDNTNFQSMGLSPHRSVCKIQEQTDNTVLFMVSTSPSFSTGCPVNCMAEHVCICISPRSVNSEGSESHAAVPVQVDSHSPKLAEAALVPSSAKNVDSKTNQITSNSESVDTRQRESNASKSRDIAVDCMATIDRAFRTRGFSENTRKLLAASWRKGTQKDYNCKFRKLNSWCSEQEIDPYTASLTDCAHFLTFLFDKGLKYKTITGYRSMLSSLLAPVEKFPVGQHRFIIRLLRGIFNQRPPLRKLVPEWDLPLVLGCLKKPPFEPMKEASLKYVTWKTCFLIAITCFRRCSDIQALRLGEGNINVQKKGLTFLLAGLSKQDRPNHHSRKIFVPSFPSNKLLDPKRAMTYYLKKTECFRIQGSENELKLFLSVIKPHEPVLSQTISKWLVNVIKFAYKKSNKQLDKVKGHSTHSIGPSWALFKGASLDQVLDAADWSSETTFIKHYMKNVNVNILDFH